MKKSRGGCVSLHTLTVRILFSAFQPRKKVPETDKLVREISSSNDKCDGQDDEYNAARRTYRKRLIENQNT